MNDKQIFINDLVNFMKNSIMIKTREPGYTKTPKIGHFGFFTYKTKVLIDNGGDATAMFFIGYNQTIHKGIFPVIVYNVLSDVDNFEICYGTSQTEDSEYKWAPQYTESKAFSSSKMFSKSSIKTVFTINTLQEFVDNVTLIYQNIDSILSEYRTNFLCPNRVVSQMQVADTYKIAAEKINQKARKDIRANSLRGIMKESFFHGASSMGSNFIS